jgi:hypothetical protein
VLFLAIKWFIGGINLDKNRISGYIIITFVVIINLFGFMGSALLLFKEDSELVSGALSFVGSILGGLITFVGVKYTLEYNSNEKEIDSSSKKIFLVEDFIYETRSHFNALFILESANNLSDEAKKESYIRIVNEFNDKLNRHYKKIRMVLDYDFISILGFHRQSLQTIVFMLNNNPKENVYSDGIEKVRDIYGSLIQHKQSLVENYYSLKRRQKKLL